VFKKNIKTDFSTEITILIILYKMSSENNFIREYLAKSNILQEICL
jgi:hypothetical protein